MRTWRSSLINLRLNSDPSNVVRAMCHSITVRHAEAEGGALLPVHGRYLSKDHYRMPHPHDISGLMLAVQEMFRIAACACTFDYPEAPIMALS